MFNHSSAPVTSLSYPHKVATTCFGWIKVPKLPIGCPAYFLPYDAAEVVCQQRGKTAAVPQLVDMQSEETYLLVGVAVPRGCTRSKG